MPKKLIEENIEFTFGDSWVVEKYDDHADTRAFVGVVESRKAMDFVGLNKNIVFFLEIKDYRGHRIENKPKTNGELIRVIAQKAYDTLAGLLLTQRRTPGTQLWRQAFRACGTEDGDVRVVLWLEDDALFRQPGRRSKSAAAIFTTSLKKKMKWFPGKVLVVNRAFNAGGLPDVSAKNLPGAAGRGGTKK